MTRLASWLLGTVACILVASSGWAKCSPDAVEVGPTCVDKYEASVWRIPPTNRRLIAKVKRGAATLSDLRAGGAEQVSPGYDPDYACTPPFPPSFPATGNWTEALYAVSVPGVLPTSCASWFQAEQACRLSGKRLPTNQEWQAAAAGTPDPLNPPPNDRPECNVERDVVEPAGSSTACVSRWGAFDMIGNLSEWVADWTALGTSCPGWGGFAPNDAMCLAGASTTEGPGALVRGGNMGYGSSAGIFAVGPVTPTFVERSLIGFRCAR
jgi:formylglycine-generating enzyme required for sulfatase activity